MGCKYHIVVGNGVWEKGGGVVAVIDKGGKIESIELIVEVETTGTNEKKKNNDSY